MNGKLQDLSKKELLDIYQANKTEYDNILCQKLSLNMARGKPSPEQLDLGEDILKAVINNESVRKALTAEIMANFMA